MAKLKELSYLCHLFQHKKCDQNVLIFHYMKNCQCAVMEKTLKFYILKILPNGYRQGSIWVDEYIT